MAETEMKPVERSPRPDWYSALILPLIMVAPIPILMIVIGATYKNQCPINDKIPIFLVVGGAVGVLRFLIWCLGVKLKAQEFANNHEGMHKKKIILLKSILDIFLFAWFICGTVWTVPIFPPDYDDPSSSEYCHRSVYLCAFLIGD
ncbi:hypothetical protein OS493_011570 [Desmophyllum pertusum]|uniref:Uncharacterized protein n=1 Tax=Desmophyllum pertusum TaxID=174260 RepID=A0A9W9YQM4_9CNID|nr:hypothetical protein OS493_011570 [Desmophyllum pertusum]